jgi:phage baseplate assembly protein W
MPYKNIEIGEKQVVQQSALKQSQFYKGFSTVDPTRTENTLFDFDIIKQDILNHFNTRKGERVMNPGFGSVIWSLLMEPLTEEIRTILKKDIETICNFDPRVVPIQLNVVEYDSGFLIEITLQLVGTNQSSNMRLTFDQKVGLTVQ